MAELTLQAANARIQELAQKVLDMLDDKRKGYIEGYDDGHKDGYRQGVESCDVDG